MPCMEEDEAFIKPVGWSQGRLSATVFPLAQKTKDRPDFNKDILLRFTV